MTGLNFRSTIYLIALLCLASGGAVLIPLVFAAVTKDPGAGAFLPSFLLFTAAGVAGLLVQRRISPRHAKLPVRRAYLLIVLGFLALLLVCALPYRLSPAGLTMEESWFESCAGWTTTAARFSCGKALSRPFLLWKAITCWLGGIALLLLTGSLFTRLGLDDSHLEPEERMIANANTLSLRRNLLFRTVLLSYGILTIIGAGLLISDGCPPFYAIVNALSAQSTSGLIDPACGGAFLVPTGFQKLIYGVLACIGSVNCLAWFSLRSEKESIAIAFYEIRVFFLIAACMTVVITGALLLDDTPIAPIDAGRDALFESVSFLTTAGFSTKDLNSWPVLAQFVLLLGSICGGCGYSCAGGIKIRRVIIGFKAMMRGFYKRIHPRAVRPIIVQGEPISAQKVSSIVVFFFLYFMTFMLGAILLGTMNRSLDTTLNTVFACLSNTGEGFGDLMQSGFQAFPPAGRVLCSFLMITGRLEIYPVLFLLSRSFWSAGKVHE